MVQQKTNIAHSTTQLFLDLYDITNDLIILADGATSLVITVSAMNFGLLSENEQDATIYAYAALLNSLSFPIQIVIRSQPKDVTGYLKKIQELEDRSTNQVYRQKIREYRTFVESLVQEQNVLDKKFYIVVPLSAVEMGLTTQSVIPGSKNKALSSFEKNFIIEKAKTNLLPRRDHLIDQLARIGLYSRQLTTQELIQMLYSSYNPESFEGQKVTDTSHYTTPLVQAKIQGDFSMDTQMPAQPMTPAAPTAPAPSMSQPAAPSMPAMAPTMTPPPAPSMPGAPTMPPLSTPAAPMAEFTKTDLGYSTPAAMSSMATPAASTEPQTVFTAPTIAESPVVSVPEDKPSTPLVSTPVMPTAMPTATPNTVVATPSATPVADPQAMINQTLGNLSPAMGTSPTATPSMTTPVAAPSIMPELKIDN